MDGVFAETAGHHDDAVPGDGGAEEGDWFPLRVTEEAAEFVRFDGKGAAADLAGMPATGGQEVLEAADGERHHFQHLEGGCEGVEERGVCREVGDLAVEHPRAKPVGEVADQAGPGDAGFGVEEEAADGAGFLGALGGFRGEFGPHREEDGAAEAGYGAFAGPERHLAHASAELDGLHLGCRRHALAVEAGRCLQHAGPGGGEHLDACVPRGGEGAGIERAAGGVAP